jgi:predicted signal transduction protein with EAL and GGDEF domain
MFVRLSVGAALAAGYLVVGRAAITTTVAALLATAGATRLLRRWAWRRETPT